MHKIYKVAPFVLLAVSAGLLYMYFHKSAEWRRQRAEYNVKLAKVEKEKVASDERIVALQVEVLQRDANINKLKVEALADEAKIHGLQAELAALQGAEPEQPELEKEPLVINLRAQIKKQAEMFSLAQSQIEKQDRQIAELEAKCFALDKIGKEWKAQYENEHTLRLMAQDLLVHEEHQSKTEKWIWRTIAAGGLAYGFLK